MNKIVITEGMNKGSEIPLRGETLVAGRSMSCNLRLPDHGVAREHARFRREGEAWIVEDLGSRNGTRLNGKGVAGTAPLAPGDRVQIGSVVLEFQSAPGDGSNGNGGGLMSRRERRRPSRASPAPGPRARPVPRSRSTPSTPSAPCARRRRRSSPRSGR